MNDQEAIPNRTPDFKQIFKQTIFRNISFSLTQFQKSIKITQTRSNALALRGAVLLHALHEHAALERRAARRLVDDAQADRLAARPAQLQDRVSE